MPLRGLAALLFLGGIVYALVSGNWGIGAIVFGLVQLQGRLWVMSCSAI